MMLEVVSGDLLQADAEAYVNAVNCKGVMGAGIALQFKNRFPDYFREYQKACRKGTLLPGGVLPWVKPYDLFDRHNNSRPRYVISFATKNDWRFPSKMHWITEGLFFLIQEIKDLDIKSIALPALGCGKGGLRWEEVYQKVEFAFRNENNVRVLLYMPQEDSNGSTDWI